MGRRTLILNGSRTRAQAIHWINKAPDLTSVEFRTSRRSVPQNSLMWHHLGRISDEVEWDGLKLSAEDWKTLFMDALNRELRLARAIDGTGVVNLGVRSSSLTKDEMSDLITLIEAFAAEHEVDLGHERPL